MGDSSQKHGGLYFSFSVSFSTLKTLDEDQDRPDSFRDLYKQLLEEQRNTLNQNKKQEEVEGGKRPFLIILVTDQSDRLLVLRLMMV